MKKKTNKILDKIFLLFVISSLVISFIEGLIYYTPQKYPNGIVRYMLITRNSIKSFVFETDIKIENVAQIINTSTTVWERVISYLYLFTMFIAPYCTLSLVYRIIRKALVLGKKKHSKNYKGIVIIGYNEDVKSILKDYKKNKKEFSEYRIHLVDYKIDSEEEYQLLMDNVIVHRVDCLNLPEHELKKFFSQIKLKWAKYIILFDTSSINNFSIYRMFNENKEKAGIDKDVKFFCRCENAEIMTLLEEFHDDESEFDMETVSVPELRIKHTFDNVPLHGYYLNKTQIPVKEWNLHMLIIGFGEIGQQALLQAMNQGVVSSKNKILIDVVDIDITNKYNIFANIFNDEFVEIEENQITIPTDRVDGEFKVRFHQMDIRHKQISTLLQEYGNRNTDGIYTYIAVCVEDGELGIHCLNEVKYYMRKCVLPQDYDDVSIIIRMEGNKHMKEYLNKNKKTFNNVIAIENSGDVLTLGKLIRDELDNIAKEINRIYHRINIVDSESDFEQEEDENLTKKELWYNLKLFKRESSRATAEHASIKEVIWERMIGNKDFKEQLQYLFGKEGVLLKDKEGVWIYDSEDAFVKKQSDRQMYPYVSELSRMEHRRWCYFMVSRGWGSCEVGEKNEDRLIQEKRTECLCTWEQLVRVKKETCKYDLMWLLKKYNEIIIQGEKKDDKVR